MHMLQDVCRCAWPAHLSLLLFCVQIKTTTCTLDKSTKALVWTEVGSGMPLEARMLKLKLSYFGQLIRADGLEKDLMLGMGNRTKSRWRPRRRWLEEIRRPQTLIFGS